MNILDKIISGGIKRRNIERVIGPLTSQKHSFVYKSDKFPFEGGKSFYVVYKTDKSETFVDENLKILLPRVKNWKTTYGSYMASNPNQRRENYLKPYKFILTNKMKKNNYVTRYFAKENYFGDEIFEIKKQDIGDHAFYKTTTIFWNIKGIREDVKKNNENELIRADRTLKGMRYFLDPLQFYVEEEPTRLETLNDKLSKLKYSNSGY